MSFIPDFSRMAVTADALSLKMTNFAAHYVLAGCSDAFSGKEVNIPLQDLVDHVGDFMRSNNCTEEEVGLILVPSFNKGSQSMYYRLLLCTLSYAYTADDLGVFNIGNRYASFKAVDGSLMASSDLVLKDEDYFNNLYYVANPPCTGENAVPLYDEPNGALYTRRVSTSWGYVLKPLLDQNITGTEYDEFTLCIAATASSARQVTDVLYPQDLAFYPKRGTTPLLGNQVDPVKPLKNMAANMVAMCPPNCWNITTVPAAG